MDKGILILLLGFFLSLVIRTLLILNGSEVGDIHALFEMGEVTLKGANPYIVLGYNSYPPLALYIEILTIKLSQIFNIPFYMLIKLWPNLADFLTAFLIFWGLKKHTNIKSAAIWSLVFLLNPISILISASHGQLDSIPTFLTVLAAILLQFKVSKMRVFTAALLLGFSISIKPNPLFLLPVFLTFMYKNTTILQKLGFIVLTFTPIIVLMLPFLQSNPQYVVERLVNYSGSSDFFLAAPLRTWYFYQHATYNLPFIDILLSYSKIIFSAALILIIILKNAKDLIKLVLIAYLTFLTIYFGISAQYLSWILPFGILLKDKMVVPYTLFGLISLLGFYMYFNPAIIISHLSTIEPYNFQCMLTFAVGNLVLWFVIVRWLIKILRR